MGLFRRRKPARTEDSATTSAPTPVPTSAPPGDAPRGPSPRCQHSTFAHHAFRQVAFRDGGKLIHALGLLEGPRLVRELWDAVAMQCAARGMPPEPDGDRPRVHPRRIADCPAVLLAMPPALAITEAHLIAAVQLPESGGPDSAEPAVATGRMRYYTLERAPGDGAEADQTVIGEWNADGGHRLLGPGPAPDLDAFAQAVAEIVLSGDQGPAQQ